MVAFPRKDVVREGEVGIYHVWSRCAQQWHLMGQEEEWRIDFGHRRQWLESLLRYHSQVFAVDLANFSILSNHFHLVVRTRPDIVETWSDEMVAARWKLAWPEFDQEAMTWSREVDDRMIQRLVDDPKKFDLARKGLGSLSWFMARIKEAFSKLCNAEAGRSGAFWDERFGARELLDERAVLTCMSYVDMNQVKAGVAETLADSSRSAIAVRIAELQQAEAVAAASDVLKDKKSVLLSESEALNLFRGCHLAPIGTDFAARSTGGIYLPTGAVGPGESESAARVDDPTDEDKGSRNTDSATRFASGGEELPTETVGRTGPEGYVGPPAELEQMEVEEAAARADENRSPTKRVRTFEAIDRLFPNGLPERLSDKPILDMPLTKYIEIVRFAEARWFDQTRTPSPDVEEYFGDADQWVIATERYGPCRRRHQYDAWKTADTEIGVASSNSHFQTAPTKRPNGTRGRPCEPNGGG